jgi:hypothetical protein
MHVCCDFQYKTFVDFLALQLFHRAAADRRSGYIKLKKSRVGFVSICSLVGRGRLEEYCWRMACLLDRRKVVSNTSTEHCRQHRGGESSSVDTISTTPKCTERDGVSSRLKSLEESSSMVSSVDGFVNKSHRDGRIFRFGMALGE